MWVRNTGKVYIHYHFNGVKRGLVVGPPVELPDNEARLILGKYAKLGVKQVPEPMQVAPVKKEAPAPPKPPKTRKKKASKKKKT